LSINSSALNANAINAQSFSGAEGSGALISLEQIVYTTASGSLITLSQGVYLMGSGSILSVAQEVELRLSGSGSLIDVSQTVESIGSGALISLEQTIQSVSQATFYQKNGWDLVIALGNYVVPRETIQSVKVTHGVGDDARAEVKLNPGSNTYDLYSYQGAQLEISAYTGSTFVRIFTGVVDIPRVEVVNEKITLEGVASREVLIRELMTPYVASIGYYSTAVFGARNNVFQETNDRMSTIPYDLDFDAYNNWTITSWTPNASPDITLTNSSLYREQEPTVRIESSREIINKVSITFKYAYQRLQQASLTYSWNAGLTPCDFLTNGNTLPSREMVRSAANGAGWKLNEISFSNLWSSGWYYCGTTYIGWVNTRQDVLLRNSDATMNGNNYSTSSLVASNDISALLCLGAAWTAKKRFSQNVVEEYTLTVDSEQSQALYGIREKNENVGLESEFDSNQWEDESLYDTEFGGTKIGTSTNYYINKDVENAELSLGITTALNKAKTDILASHKDTEVSFKTFVNPNYLLRHTIYVNTTRLQAKGKVKTIVHEFNADGQATSTVSLSLYRSVGSSSNSSLTPPARPTYSLPSPMGSAVLRSRWGEDPSQTAARSWNGYTGNKWVVESSGFNRNTYRTTYQESFVVDTPPIPDERRDRKDYSIEQSYSVSIPTDTLSITFIDS